MAQEIGILPEEEDYVNPYRAAKSQQQVSSLKVIILSILLNIDLSTIGESAQFK